MFSHPQDKRVFRRAAAFDHQLCKALPDQQTARNIMELNMITPLLWILALHSTMCKGLSRGVPAQDWAFPAAFFLFISVLSFAPYNCLQWFVSNLCRGRPSWELLLHLDSFMHQWKIKYTHVLYTIYTFSLYTLLKCPYWHSNHSNQ